MDSSYESGKVSFKTNHFSEYEVVVVDEVVEPTVLYGDVDGDGFITAKDATEVLLYVAQKVSEINRVAADVEWRWHSAWSNSAIYRSD